MSEFSREFFRDAMLDVEDLYLLETFQIDYLPGWVPEREFAAVLWAHPSIERYLGKRNTVFRDFLQQTKSKHGPAANPQELSDCEDRVAWTIADLLVYNRCPEVYEMVAITRSLCRTDLQTSSSRRTHWDGIWKRS